MNEADLADFVALQATKAASPNSWTLDVTDMDPATCDLSVKNANRKEEKALRSPAEILAEMKSLDEEATDLLASIMWRAVSRTFKYGMSYLEIYASDILDLSLNNTFRRTADSLTAIGQRCFGAGLSVAGNGAGSSFEWNVYPNPAADELHISLAAIGNNAVNVELRQHGRPTGENGFLSCCQQ